MKQFQVNKQDVTEFRVVEGIDESLSDTGIELEIERFAFTANNLTYFVVGDKLGYWQFFPPIKNEDKKWGVIPVWGMAKVVKSNHLDVQAGERLFGYFPPADKLIMQNINTKEDTVIDMSEHRRPLPQGYNVYRRTQAMKGYNQNQDNFRMLLWPLYITSFCLWDLLAGDKGYDVEQIIILSASSKTSLGLAYALNTDDSAPKVVGLTGDRNKEFVSSMDVYSNVFDYQSVQSVDNSKSSAVVDMSGNSSVLTELRKHLGNKLTHDIGVGLTHRAVDESSAQQNVFFAPEHIQKRMQEWGPKVFSKRSGDFIMRASVWSQSWLSITQKQGLEALQDNFQAVADGKIDANKGLIFCL